jgi:thymidine kinase
MKTGRLEVLTGPMFSGKTSHLITRALRAQQVGQRVQILKPRIDTRYAASEVVTHSGKRLAAEVMTPDELRADPESEVIGIDEAQFFGEQVVPFVEKLVAGGARVIVAGLDMTYTGKPFHPMPHLMALANEVLKLTARCVRCEMPATRTFRVAAAPNEIASSITPILVGGSEAYEARCLPCYLAR